MAVSFDRVAGIYDATRWSGVPPEIMRKLLTTMNELFAGCRTILDVGTGTGRFAEYFGDSGFALVAIDVSLAMMAKAREKGLRNLIQADAHHLPFRDGAFDAAIMIHVLHLVRDWPQVVHEIGRVTRKVVVAEAGVGEGFSPRQRYLELRREMGYPLDRLNDGEVGLRRMLTPTHVKSAGDYWTEIQVHEEIDAFDRRRSSVSWDLTPGVNSRIIQQLHSENPGKTARRRDVVELVGWDPAQFRNLKRRLESKATRGYSDGADQKIVDGSMGPPPGRGVP